jgi:hypothetical protein
MKQNPIKNIFRTLTFGITVFSVLLLASCGPPELPAQMEKGPYLLWTGNPTSMTVQWQTLQTPRQAVIEWGPNEKYCGWYRVNENNSDTYGHQFAHTITGLLPGSLTYYRVTVDGLTYTGSFKTAPTADAKDLTFYAYGDTRSQPNIHDQVLQQVMADVALQPLVRQTFILNDGDFVRYGLDESYWDLEYFNRQYTNTLNLEANLPILGVMGNHETYNISVPDLEEEVVGPPSPDWGKLLKKYWPYTFFADPQHFYYSFDYGPVHVAMIDQYTADLTATGAQAQWLEADLKNTTKPWKIVMFHEPAYGPKDSARGADVRANMCPIFEKYGVKAVLQGHEHCYARQEVNGIQYFILGGGGAPVEAPAPGIISQYHFARFAIAGDTLTVTVINKDGQTIETVTIK